MGDIEEAKNAAGVDGAAELELVESEEFDFLYYNGPISAQLTAFIRKKTAKARHNEVRFVLVTGGGDPDAAYRSMRVLQCRYEKVVMLIPNECKSAGTLMCLGAHELAFGPHGELGPLDIQIQKKDEILGRESGAAVISAMNVLHNQCFQMFEHFFLSTVARSEGSISARMATDIAAKVSAGVYKKIFSQIDPHHLGETQRAMEIGQAYGARLASVSDNIGREGIERLIVSYPDHGFVIDEQEAEEIFHTTRKMTKTERLLAHTVKKAGRNTYYTPYPIPENDDDIKAEHADTSQDEGHGSHDGVAAGAGAVEIAEDQGAIAAEPDRDGPDRSTEQEGGSGEDSSREQA
ncbi:hypothetical protein [Xanthomonas arboricola]|uniref:hypothetical protein n=1 Tax=Xanthomonas arboricola TaxID=56448 RepID=UPI0011B0AD5C|nr:hypothetical protein [Xanthomonas arboricola]